MSELAHLPSEYRAIAPLSDDKRIEWLCTERWVGFSKAAEVVERLQTLLDYPKRPRMACLLIYGRSGMGKSMTIANFVREHPAVFDKQEGSTILPRALAKAAEMNRRRLTAR